MIDIATVRDAYEKVEIGGIGWIPGSTNTAAALTKLESKKAMEDFLDTGIFKWNNLQFFIRKGKNIKEPKQKWRWKIKTSGVMMERIFDDK